MKEQQRGKGSKAAPRAKRELVRGEPVVQRVLAATMEELARVGYRALRVEDVAARAEVNKTTVYRRWPEKSGLVRDALSCMAGEKLSPPDTGSLRGDLLALGKAMVALASAPQGQSVMRMLVAEGSDAEVADIKKSVRKTRELIPLAMIAKAVARGELRPSTNNRVVFEALIGAIHHRLFFRNETVSAAFLERLVDVLLWGAQIPKPAPAAARGRSRAPRAR